MSKLYMVILFLLFFTFANAGTVIVTNTNNTGTGSLRNAISSASAGDTIRFSPSLISSGSDSIVLFSSISFSKKLTIKGLYNSADTLYISGGGNSGVFHITNTTNVYLDSLSIKNGKSYFGSIYFKNSDSLFITNSLIKKSSGVIYCYSSIKEVFLSLINCTFIDNSSLSSSVVYLGGYKKTVLQMKNCFIEKNKCRGIELHGRSPSFFKGILIINVDSSIIKNNSIVGGVGGVGILCKSYSYDSSASNITISNSNISDNRCNSCSGGGIYSVSNANNSLSNVTIKNSIFNNNFGNLGGGIYVKSIISKIKVYNSTFKNNVAHINGGAIYSYSPLKESHIDVINSTFNNCKAGNYDISPTGFGGGIFSRGSLLSKINIKRSTFTQNVAVHSGGGIYSYSNNSSQLNIENSTIYKNNVDHYGGGVYNNGNLSSTNLYIQGSIISSNQPTNIHNRARPIISSGYNSFSDYIVRGSVLSDLKGFDSTDLNLGPLSFNGGNTQTLLPLYPSVAYNNGNPLDTNSAQNINVYNRREIGAAEACYSVSKDTVFTCDSLVMSSGIIHRTSGIYRDTLVNSRGCDSVVFINLIIHKSKFIKDTVVACNSYLWRNGITYTNSTSATYFLTNRFGCDSSFSLHLTIENLDTSVLLIYPYYKAKDTSANYQWLDCNNSFAVIPGANGQWFTIPSSGSYAVQLTKNGCRDTSFCHSINNVSITENNILNNISLYPNPTNGMVYLDFGNKKISARIVLKDVSGKTIMESKILQKQSFSFTVSDLNTGIYFVIIYTKDGRKTLKLIKK